MDENSKASDYINEEEELGFEPSQNIKMTQNENNDNGSRGILEILKTQTGSGTIDSYIDNPLNFNQSKAIAQILRGLSGFLGALNYAILDIIIGTFNFSKELKKDV